MPADLQPPTDYDPVASVGGNWREFVVVGAILVVCGVAAIFAPAVANFATSTLLGTLLVIAGGACVYQAMHTKDWAGYNWQLLLGAGEMVGDIFIVINGGGVAHAMPAHRERISTDPYGIVTLHERRLVAKEPRWCRRSSRDDAEPQGPALAAAATMCRQDRNANDSSSVR